MAKDCSGWDDNTMAPPPRKRLTSKTRDSIIRRNLRKLNDFEDGDREDAISAAQKAAKTAVETVFVADNRQSTVFGTDLIELRSSYSPLNNNNNIDDISNDSQSSFLSRERALFRGSTRGFFEENENGKYIGASGSGSLDGFSLDRGDLTTIEETRQSTTESSKIKKKRGERFSSFFQASRVKNVSGTGQVSAKAWMCGVCSKSFSSFDAAKKHEDYHIKEIVMDLGWLCETPAPMSSGGNLNTATRPDSLAVSKTGESRNRRSTAPGVPIPPPGPPPSLLYSNQIRYEPINDFDDFLNEVDPALHDGVPGYTVLADEALIDVCSKAEALILSQVEREAEFELEILSRDNSYYHMLEMRDIKRREEGVYSRFRTDGKNLAQKVQNKLVDAYAIMKEGKDKKSNIAVDHYKRKYKGGSDVQTEIENTTKTLYVNVIVKNSIKVVSHELDRLAKQRWEEYKETHEEKLDGRSADTKAQFEKFKAMAQGNLVKLAGYALASDFTPRRIAVQLSNDLYR
jgi:hypothetical protein